MNKKLEWFRTGLGTKSAIIVRESRTGQYFCEFRPMPSDADECVKNAQLVCDLINAHRQMLANRQPAPEGV